MSDKAESEAILALLRPAVGEDFSEADLAVIVDCLRHAAEQGCDWSRAPAAAGRRASLQDGIEQLCAAGAIDALALEFERHSDDPAKAGIHWTCRRLRLMAACQALYPVFKRYRIESFLRAIDFKANGTSPPSVNKLSAQVALGHFSFDDDRLCRGVLPRALELMALGENDGVLTLGAQSYLTSNKWWEWPSPERKALQDYIEASWLAFLARFPSKMWDLSDLIFIDAIFEICPDGVCARLIRLWRSDRHLPATLALAYYLRFRMQAKDLGMDRESRISNRAILSVRDWCRGNDAQGRLLEAFDRHPNARFSSTLAEAVDLAQWLATRP